MIFRLSAHAQIEMQRRGISLEQVSQVINNPQQILTQPDGAAIYQSQLDFGTQRLYLLRVFLNTSVEPALVITTYRTSQIQKYWSTP